MGSMPTKNTFFDNIDQELQVGIEAAVAGSDKQIQIRPIQNEYFTKNRECALQRLAIDTPQKTKSVIEKEYLELNIKILNTPENEQFLKQVVAQVKRVESQQSPQLLSPLSGSSILKRSPKTNSSERLLPLRKISGPITGSQKSVHFSMDEVKKTARRIHHPNTSLGQYVGRKKFAQ